MYYPCSENKGADQLHGYREADLRLCFSHMQKSWFSHDEAQFFHRFNPTPLPNPAGSYCCLQLPFCLGSGLCGPGLLCFLDFLFFSTPPTRLWPCTGANALTTPGMSSGYLSSLEDMVLSVCSVNYEENENKSDEQIRRVFDDNEEIVLLMSI